MRAHTKRHDDESRRIDEGIKHTHTQTREIEKSQQEEGPVRSDVPAYSRSQRDTRCCGDSVEATNLLVSSPEDSHEGRLVSELIARVRAKLANFDCYDCIDCRQVLGAPVMKPDGDRSNRLCEPASRIAFAGGNTHLSTRCIRVPIVASIVGASLDQATVSNLLSDILESTPDTQE